MLLAKNKSKLLVGEGSIRVKEQAASSAEGWEENGRRLLRLIRERESLIVHSSAFFFSLIILNLRSCSLVISILNVFTVFAFH